MQIICPNEEIEETEETEKSAVALGYFDGVHLGHAAVIGAAVETGLKATIVTFLEHPSDLFNNRKVLKIMSRELKEQAFEKLGVKTLIYLDFAHIRGLSAETFIRDLLIERYHAGFVFCGFNYRFGKGAQAGPPELASICEKYGVRGISVKPVCAEGLPVSSTRIRALIESGDLRQAARLLNRPFSFYLEVVHGKHLGRSFGTPTINQVLEPLQVCPLFGVYASKAHIGGRLLQAVTNIGVKPTVGSDHISAESFIFDYSGDLYGQKIQIDLMEFLRPEKKFENLDLLRAQILSDASSAKNFFEKLHMI